MSFAEDHVIQEGPWRFDAGVSAAFEDMLARSIPDYSTMRGLVTDLAMRFRRRGTLIADLGCSRGDAIAPLIERYGEENSYLACDVSEPMLDVCRARFAANPRCSVQRHDLRDSYPVHAPASCSVTLCVLTLQFTPIEYRQRILADAFRATAPGGVLILVEKLLGATYPGEAVQRELYYRLKATNGYSVEEIERKRLALEGVLVPVSVAENERLLAAAGFPVIEMFWRFLCFAGWWAMRPYVELEDR